MRSAAVTLALAFGAAGVAVAEQPDRVVTETHAVTADDGVSIPVTLYRSPQALGRRPAVVLLHGFSDREPGSVTLPRALALTRDVRYVTVVPDRRTSRPPLWARPSGTGEGIASPIFGKDMVTVVEWLRRHPAVDPARVAFVGLSDGGGEALRAAALLGPERAVSAVVVQAGSGLAARSVIDPAAVRRIASPVLVVHGTADTIASPGEPFALREALEAAGRPYLFRWLQGVGHHYIAIPPRPTSADADAARTAQDLERAFLAWRLGESAGGIAGSLRGCRVAGRPLRVVATDPTGEPVLEGAEGASRRFALPLPAGEYRVRVEAPVGPLPTCAAGFAADPAGHRLGAAVSRAAAVSVGDAEVSLPTLDVPRADGPGAFPVALRLGDRAVGADFVPAESDFTLQGPPGARPPARLVRVRAWLEEASAPPSPALSAWVPPGSGGRVVLTLLALPAGARGYRLAVETAAGLQLWRDEATVSLGGEPFALPAAPGGAPWLLTRPAPPEAPLRLAVAR